MYQFGGKQTKSSSDSKRHFTVVIGSKEHGLYISSTPSSAAKKAVTKLCASNKGKKVDFHIREITQGSKKKTYGPYVGHIEKLKEPIELKGRIIKYKPVAKLSKKSGGGAGSLKNRLSYRTLENQTNQNVNTPPPALPHHLSRNKINYSMLSNKNRLKQFITKHFSIEIEDLEDFFDNIYESNGLHFDVNYLNKLNNSSSELDKENFIDLLDMYINQSLRIQDATNIFFKNHPELSENEKKFLQDYVNSLNFQYGFYDTKYSKYTKVTHKKNVPDNKNYQIDKDRKGELTQLVYELVRGINIRKNYSIKKK